MFTNRGQRGIGFGRRSPRHKDGRKPGSGLVKHHKTGGGINTYNRKMRLKATIAVVKFLRKLS